MTPDQQWDHLPPEILDDCAQLTKANSIEGNKKDNVTIIYTPWSNLHKTANMATGQVSFKDPRKTRKLHVPTRHNPTINRLDKTRTAATPSTDDLSSARETYLAAQRAEKRRVAEREMRAERAVVDARRREKEEREKGWEALITMHRTGEGAGGEAEGNNQGEGGGFDEDDFM